MAWNRRIVGIGLGMTTAAFVVAATDAEARVRHLAPRHAPRRRHRFKSAPAPAHAKTPALDSNGASGASSAAPVAGAAVEGSFRQDVVDGGTLLVMSPDRALVLNSYRGLLLVDTSDFSTPRTLASIAVQGTGERMLLGDGEVAVVSDARDSSGARTLVTSIAVGASSLSVQGVAQVTGALRDVAREGADLLLVTNDAYVGPIVYMTAAGTGGPGLASPTATNGGVAAGRPSTSPNALVQGGPSSGIAYPWNGSGKAHVARVRIGADGSPSALGEVDVDGDVLSDALTGTDAVLAVQSGGWFAVPLVAPKDPSSDGSSTQPTVSLLRFSDDANGAPTSAGKLDLAGITGIAALDRDGAVLRVLEYADAGEIVATFDLSGGAPSALGSLALADWPSASAFSGATFVYGTTSWYMQTPTPNQTLPPNPVFNRDVVDATLAGLSGDVGDGRGIAGLQDFQTSTLRTVDLRDPSHLVAGGAASLGVGWLGGFSVVAGGIVGTQYDYAGATTVFRVDASDPTSPRLAGSAALTGYSNLGPVLGDLLLVDGGSNAADGSFQSSTQLVDLSGGGLALGGSFSAASWTSAAARDGNVLGLASYDRLTLVDVGDKSSPQVGGEVRLVVNVAGFAALDASTGAVLATDYVGGGVEIRSVALPAADPLAALDVLKVGTGDAQMFAAAPYLYVVATDWSTGRASLTVVDARDPSHLAARGSLDLAAYPGQVYLKGSALLLLREASNLFYETDAGATKAATDSFGRCPKAWLKDSLAGVLDVVDLSNPDAPAASARLPLDWDASGVAVLSGDSLFVPSYVDVTNSNSGDDQYAYMVQEIDVTNPLRPAAHTPQDVPGALVAATGDPHRVLTTEYAYDDSTGATTTSLHVVDLSLPWSSRVLATTQLDGYPDSVTVGAGHAYVVVETWNDATTQTDPSAPSSPSSKLVAYGLSDLAVTSTTSRDVGAYAGEIHAGYLFLRTWGWTGSIDEYSLASSDAPAFVASQEVAGLAGDLVVVGARAYAPGGLYGVESFELDVPPK